MNSSSPKIIKAYVPFDDFLSDWHVRVTWIGFLTLWVFWGFTWFIRNAFGGDQGSHTIQSNAQIAADRQTAGTTTDGNVATDPETGATTTSGAHTGKYKQYLAAPAWSVNVFNRLNRAHDMLRDLILLLLSVLTLNTFARASTRAVMIITWIYVAFAFIYFFVEASYEHRYLRLLYSITFYSFGLAIAGLAYAYGFLP